MKGQIRQENCLTGYTRVGFRAVNVDCSVFQLPVAPIRLDRMSERLLIRQGYRCITLLKSKKTQILLFLFSLPSHPSAVSYGPRVIVWHPDARQTAQTSSRWLFTALRSPTTASSHRALPWPTAPQNRPAQAVAGAPGPAVTTQKARGPAGWAGGTRRPGRERQQHAQGQQSGPAAGPDLPRPGFAC